MAAMKYRIPTDEEALDLLSDTEIHLYKNERAAIERGRAKARELHRMNGPTGQLRELTAGAVIDSYAILTGYTKSSQVSPMVTAVSLSEGVQFTCSLERSLIDGSTIGVRVTLVAFTR